MAGAFPIHVHTEIYPPAAVNLIDHIDGAEGRYVRADLAERIGEIADAYRGQVQLIYMDPPFYTGQSFAYAQPVGEEGYRGGRKINHIAYRDPAGDRDAYLSLMRRVFVCARDMLTESGSLYLHVDYRAAAHLRLLLDDVFGEEHFVNEIIWHYRSGGRSVHHFSRKHDNLYLYRKSDACFFDIESVGEERGEAPRNHMKRQVDEYGRVYFSIRSAGREYRYYADEKVYPSDVWDDISHLQQRDPERTGYDTQKPLALLERIISVSSRPEDLVADLFAGSGTTLAAAQKLNRRWLGVDSSAFSMAVVRKRLMAQSLGTVNLEDTMSGMGDPVWACEAAIARQHQKLLIEMGDIRAIDLPEDALPPDIDAWELIDGWAAGRIDGMRFCPLKWSFRSADTPELPRRLSIPAQTKSDLPTGIALYDVWGRAAYFMIEQPGD